MAENLPAILTLTIADFRAMFPVFANPVAFPDAVINMQYATATIYISDSNCGVLNGTARLTALYQMTAHLIALNVLVAENDGSVPGITTAARVGSVSVTLLPPPAKNQFQWWLNQTPYGAALLALLKRKAVGGFFIGGGGEGPLGGFRRAGGGFWPGG